MRTAGASMLLSKEEAVDQLYEGIQHAVKNNGRKDKIESSRPLTIRSSIKR
jgi:hypothetical protein